MCPLQAAQVHVLPEDAETERPCFICIILASPVLTVGAPPDSRTTVCVGGGGVGWLLQGGGLGRARVVGQGQGQEAKTVQPSSQMVRLSPEGR